MADSQEIPCSHCEDFKQHIEAGGWLVVTGCEPIPAEPGWCLVSYKIKAAAVETAKANAAAAVAAKPAAPAAAGSA